MKKKKTNVNKNTAKFTWFWPEANKTVVIEYNPVITTQANLLKNIWTAGSFDKFKHWASERRMNVTVFNGVNID